MQLTKAQKGDFNEITELSQQMNQAKIRVNALIAANGFKVPRLSMPELGTMQHKLDGIAFEHEVAQAKAKAAAK